MEPWASEGDPRESARRVRALMQGFPRAWYIAGPWALAIYIRRVLRPREDVEIAIFRVDLDLIRQHLVGWEFEKIPPADRDDDRGPWQEGERLDPRVWDLRASRPVGSPARLRIRVMELKDGTWRFRRDSRITRPLAEIGLIGCEGMPILAPEVALLCGAEAGRPEDEEDFRNVRDVMGPDRRRWLSETLAKAYPGHPWLSALEAEPKPA